MLDRVITGLFPLPPNIVPPRMVTSVVEGGVDSGQASEVSDSEIESILCRLKSRNKAPGPDGLHARVLAVTFPYMGETIRGMFDLCLRSGRFPTIWKEGQLCLIRKEARALNSPGAYRPIILLDEGLRGGRALAMLDHLTSLQYSVESYCAMLLLPLVLLTQVRYLKFLVPFSLLANVCLLITFAITCFYTFGDLPDTSKVKLAAGMEGWPLFISTAIFAMEGINVVMPVENEMKKPQDFLGCPGVLNMTMALVVILYGVMGIFGYMKYGEEVLGSITLNLPQDENLALTAKVLVAIAVFFTYGLQMYAPMDILWLRIGSRVGQKYHNLGQIILRTVSVTLTVILAIAVPDLELLIGLVGAIFFSTLGIFIPAVIEIVHKWERGLGKWNYIVGKNCILLLIYVIVLTSGCYSSISQIIVKLGS
ncbi:unnamed protein product [Pieris brassicae]|uniref:Amino acid transporter transmembrane domain-containing protein n=1 Tax=Pieris brassicae TaxID=7116 RepID=A0A9P0TSF7_PIEBR|nr:unnamed protein product [Pieris brassicae]